MKRLYMVLLVLIGVILAIFLTRHPILRAIGNFLVVGDKSQTADILVVLVGNPERIKEAVRLYSEEVAENIVISGSTPQEHRHITCLLQKESKRLDVILPEIIWEETSRHTFEHPIYVKPILTEHGFDSAIVLSSPYHMRRAAMLFDRAFRDEDIVITYHYVRDSGFDPDHWWQDPGMRGQVGLEYLKLGVNFWGTRFSRLVVKLARNESQ